MSVTKSIARNTIIQIIGKAVSTLLGLVAVAILTRALGAEKFGWYSTAIGFLQFVAVLADFGFTVTTAKMLSEPNSDKKILLNNLFTWRLITAVLSQGTAATAIWFFPYSATIKIATVILALSFIPNIINQVFTGFYQTRLRMDIMMIGEVVGRVVLVAGLWFLARGNHSFMPMMWVVVIAAWVYTLYVWGKYKRVTSLSARSPSSAEEGAVGGLAEPLLRAHPHHLLSGGEETGKAFSKDKVHKIKLQINKDITKSIFRKMWPIALGVIFNAFYLQGDRLILPLYVNAVEVGFYGVSYRVLDILSQVAFMTMGIMLPLLTFSWSRSLKDEFKKYYQMSFDLMLLTLLPMVAGALALASPILRLIAGPEYAPAAPILVLLSFAVLGICFGSTFSQMALAIDRQKQATWIFAIDAALSIPAYFIFIPRYGAIGAAYVTIFSEFFAGLGFFSLCAYHTGIWPRLLTSFKILLASVAMGIILFWLQPLNIILSIIIGVVIYGVLALTLKIVSLQTIREVMSINSSQKEDVA